MRIKITSDSTCDLTKAQIQEHDITIYPMIVNKGDQSYRDGVDITPADIYAHVAAGNPLCSTSAGSVGEYIDFFGPLSKEYDAVVHINLGSGFSSTHQNACLAAQEFDNVYPIDSRNLSTGQGHVVLEACRLAKTESNPKELCRKLKEFTPKVNASFLLDRLDYMVKGGRCSSVAMLGANLLRLKPCIEVADNKMVVAKKYRGNYNKCLETYVRERLQDMSDLRTEEIFLTHTLVSQESVDTVRKTIEECGQFENIYESTAGCTVTCHCGEGTLGILYVHK